MIVLITVFFILLSLYCYKTYVYRYRQFPTPGLCLPIVGHSYKLLSKANIKDPINGLWTLYRQHQRDGMLFLNTFTLDNVWIGDYDTLKYVFNLPEATKRLDNLKLSLSIKKLSEDQEMPGILMSHGSIWQQQRRFTIKTLKDFGFGKQGMEEMIQEEVATFKSLIEQNMSKPFDFMNKLNLPILNALWRITVGERFDYDNPRLLSIVERLTASVALFGHPLQALKLAFPRLALTFPKLFQRDVIVKILGDIIDLMQESIDKHRETFDANAPRDFIDMMLIEIENTKDKNSSFYGQAGLDNLKINLFDLFLAGSETTSTTLTWAALYMVRYPEVQKKVQEELDNVVGVNRSPSMTDKPNLPYTEAVLMEIQRHANIVPLGVPHISTKDIKVKDQIIPVNTVISPMMAEILKGEHWGDGKSFRPERFLDKHGNVQKDEHLIPFSTGKRQCLGETLAKTELFLFFTGLVQHFKFLPEVEGFMPKEEWTMGMTSLPKPFRVRLNKRY